MTQCLLCTLKNLYDARGLSALLHSVAALAVFLQSPSVHRTVPIVLEALLLLSVTSDDLQYFTRELYFFHSIAGQWSLRLDMTDQDMHSSVEGAQILGRNLIYSQEPRLSPA